MPIFCRLLNCTRSNGKRGGLFLFFEKLQIFQKIKTNLFWGIHHSSFIIHHSFMELKSIAVYCGSMPGTRPIYAEKAAELGKLLADEHICLVYGGGNVGLMGVVANAALTNGVHVTGVAPHFLMLREVLHDELHDMHIVESMHERRLLMIEKSDAFIAMPGGYGTLDEIGEVLMLTILGDRKFPCGFLNVDGFYDAMKIQLDRMTADGFLQQEYRDNAIFAAEPAELLQKLRNFIPPQYDKFKSGDIHAK
jgi:uncharacterized protein (TIGR00730 family)